MLLSLPSASRSNEAAEGDAVAPASFYLVLDHVDVLGRTGDLDAGRRERQFGHVGRLDISSGQLGLEPGGEVSDDAGRQPGARQCFVLQTHPVVLDVDFVAAD